MEIKFNKNFIKLHNQTSAQLIDVKMVDLSSMNDDDFNELVEYDCKSDDGYYPLDRNKIYTLLIFNEGEKSYTEVVNNPKEYLFQPQLALT